MKGFKTIAIILSLVSASAAYAKPLSKNTIKYLSFSQPVVTEIPDKGLGKMGPLEMGLNYDVLMAAQQAPSKMLLLPQFAIDINELVNIGKAIWDVVSANKPVVNITTDQATVVPRGISDWTALQGWKVPASKVYQVTAKNMFGMTVVNCTYRVLYNYGGNVNGRGHFINRATILPSDISVAWGYNFDMNVKVPTYFNMGSSADPIAAVNLQVDWTINTVVRHLQQAGDYIVQGTGNFTDRGTGSN